MQHVTLVPLDLRYANVIFKLSSDSHVKKRFRNKGRKNRRYESIPSFRNRRRAPKEVFIENDCK